MNYLIDFDTRSVQCKHEKPGVLDDYIFDNDLHNAVTVICCPEDLYDQLSQRELREMNDNLMGVKFAEDEPPRMMAEQVWELIEEDKSGIPNFTPVLGRKLIKEAEKERKPTKQKAAKRKPAKTPSSNAVYEIGPNKPARMAQQISAVLEFMDSNLDEATESEIVEILERLGGKTNPLTVLQGYVKKGFIQKV